MLDVGIGTATALVGRKGQNATVVVEKDLTFVGVDYEGAYIRKAIDVVRKAKLEKHVDLHCRSIYDAELASMLSGAARCDAAYFSGSLTLMPDPPAALRAAADMCKPKGLVYITQTFQNAPSPVMARLKPLLRHLTTIDFGPPHVPLRARRHHQGGGHEGARGRARPRARSTRRRRRRRLLVLSRRGILIHTAQPLFTKLTGACRY